MSSARKHTSNTKVENDEKSLPKKRTKTGCLVCRRRRIKCGEEKPSCRNCAKTKRVCEQPPAQTGKMSLSRQHRKNADARPLDEDSDWTRLPHETTWVDCTAIMESRLASETCQLYSLL
ncbi:hypothetical protein MRB53_042384 [Persea americana]|nr:hypothetical protein MRB53_042384 [Persea americana]